MHLCLLSPSLCYNECLNLLMDPSLQQVDSKLALPWSCVGLHLYAGTINHKRIWPTRYMPILGPLLLVSLHSLRCWIFSIFYLWRLATSIFCTIANYELVLRIYSVETFFQFMFVDIFIMFHMYSFIWLVIYQHIQSHIHLYLALHFMFYLFIFGRIDLFCGVGCNLYG